MFFLFFFTGNSQHDVSEVHRDIPSGRTESNFRREKGGGFGDRVCPSNEVANQYQF
jgi:hypothetical protein